MKTWKLFFFNALLPVLAVFGMIALVVWGLSACAQPPDEKQPVYDVRGIAPTAQLLYRESGNLTAAYVWEIDVDGLSLVCVGRGTALQCLVKP